MMFLPDPCSAFSFFTVILAKKAAGGAIAAMPAVFAMRKNFLILTLRTTALIRTISMIAVAISVETRYTSWFSIRGQYSRTLRVRYRVMSLSESAMAALSATTVM